jgi:hypothetical protein
LESSAGIPVKETQVIETGVTISNGEYDRLATATSIPPRRSNSWFPLRASRHAFVTCGALGVLTGLPTALLLASHLGLSMKLIAASAIAGIATLLATGMIAKILTGEELFVYFRDIAPIFAAVAGVVWAAHQPVLPYLDCIVVGACLFLAFGRIGCLFVGCCHGRPSRWGIRYGHNHANRGFPSCYVGVRLFPIQAVESLWVFCLAASAIAIVWNGAPPGTVLTFYIAAYSIGRFFIEFGRGDAARPFVFHFSEAQWTSALLLWALVLATNFHFLPNSNLLLPAAVALTLLMAALAPVCHLGFNRRFLLRHPHHVRELAQALQQLSHLATHAPCDGKSASPPPRIDLFTTSRGIHLSSSALGQSTQNQNVRHYCISAGQAPLTKSDAQTLSTLIVRLLDLPRPAHLLEGQPGIFHLFV